MPLTDSDIGAILVAENYLSAEELQNAATQSRERGLPLLTVLTDQGLLSQELYESALTEHYKIDHWESDKQPARSQMVRLLPEETARRYGVVIIDATNGSVTAAITDPSQARLEDVVRWNLHQEEPLTLEQIDALVAEPQKKSLLFGRKQKQRETYEGKITFLYASRHELESALFAYRKPLATRFQSIIESQKRVAPEILEEIFADAMELRASDVHFEPQEDVVIVRFRIDGVLREAGRIPKDNYEGVVNRIKIAANLRIDEHFTPQDGAIRYDTSPGTTMDVRISIVPLVTGEKVVMRLLSAYVQALTLTDLGYSPACQDMLRDLAHKPFGMVLATGPTGAGKSTTLYALLKMLSRPDINISTIEDPVEYKLPGINHIQTNGAAGLTFASGLRALVRQDPDVILVGEIRDHETADIAVNAALTGQLLFSTLHANTAATAIPRLLDMGTEPFLLASTLEGIIGQRLVRRICPRCRMGRNVPQDERASLFPGAELYFADHEALTLYTGKGCDACGGTGYRGRVGIFEILLVTPEIEELITARASATDIEAKARALGMKCMFDDGLEKVNAGVTTLEELLRVAEPPVSHTRHAAE